MAINFIIKKGKLYELKDKRNIINIFSYGLSKDSYIIIKKEDINPVNNEVKSFYIGRHNSNICTIKDYELVKNYSICGSHVFSCKQIESPIQEKKKLLKVTFTI